MKIGFGWGVGALALAMCGVVPGAGAQAQAGPAGAGLTEACGAAEVKFEVKSDFDTTYAPKAEAGKALVYLIQDDRMYLVRPRPTTRWGIDGAWVGATQSDAYFAVSVAPGEHHLCAEWQGNDNAVSLAHFTAEAGKTYYFRATDVLVNTLETRSIWLGPMDSDEGALWASRLRVSVATPKS